MTAQMTELKVETCNTCHGAGEVSESVYMYGPSAQSWTCETCQGRGCVEACWNSKSRGRL